MKTKRLDQDRYRLLSKIQNNEYIEDLSQMERQEWETAFKNILFLPLQQQEQVLDVMETGLLSVIRRKKLHKEKTQLMTLLHASKPDMFSLKKLEIEMDECLKALEDKFEAAIHNNKDNRWYSFGHDMHTVTSHLRSKYQSILKSYQTPSISPDMLSALAMKKIDINKESKSKLSM